MRRTRIENAGQSTRTPRRRNRQKLEPDTIDGLASPSTARSGRPNRSPTGKRKTAPAALSPRRSEEHLHAGSRKRTRIDFQEPPKKSKKKKGRDEKTTGQTTRSRPTRSRTSSTHLSHRLVDDSRSVTLSEEPPPVTKPAVASSTDGKPSHDPYIEQKRRAREEFQETGDYKAFQELLAPFRKSGKKRELTDWAFDEEVGRWWRRDKSTELIIWAPTSDCFL